MSITIASFFCGAGGMDVGFKNAGFKIMWANEFDKDIWATYRANHPETKLDIRSIFNIPSTDIPDTDGIIGGPPCQSWSAAGKNGGAEDIRGQAFFEYIRVLNDKNPKFFVVENVEGLTRSTHTQSFNQILNSLSGCGSGYTLSWQVLSASDYQVPQDRKRLFIIGIRKDIPFKYQFPTPTSASASASASASKKVTLRDTISDLVGLEVPTKTSVTSNCNCYYDSDWSSNFMSRNRVRGWDECGFTVPASCRHVTIHPQAPKMINKSKDKFIFVPGQEHLYRRFTINECARIQTFPDNYFKFNNINTAHKMIGNAVPPLLAEAIARSLIQLQLQPQPQTKIKITLKTFAPKMMVNI